mgnify:CR=1 FL=1
MELHGTTIVGVKKDGKCAIAGDGQVTLGEQVVMKATAKKVRRIYHDRVIIGFAGGVADAFALTEKFEAKLEQFSGSLMRSAVELARDWRSDKAMRNLEAMLICTDGEELLAVERSSMRMMASRPLVRAATLRWQRPGRWYAILIYPPKRSPEKPLRLQGKSVSLPTTISQ